MTLPQPDYWPDRSVNRTAVLAAGAAVGLGALAWMLWSAEQRAIAARPRDSAPSRTRKAGLAEGSALSAAATIAATPQQIIGHVSRPEDGEALARDILGDEGATFLSVEHSGDDVISWRTTDDAWLVKLVLRPIRGGQMSAVTAILARSDDRTIHFSSSAQGRISQALSRLRMWLETGELARAR